MIWIPLGVFLGGVVLAFIVIGFSAYEVNWKLRRLRTDLARLVGLGERLADLQTQVGEMQQRVTESGQR